MSLLQIQRLEGPDEILLNFNVTSTEVQPQGFSDNLDVFTCILNRPVESTDTFPIRVKVNVYNERGVLISQRVLSVSKDNVNPSRIPLLQSDCFSFRLENLSRFSGGSIYVHAFIENTGDNIRFREGFTGNYHETIKHVHIVSERAFEQVYWSGSEQIFDEGVSTTFRENELSVIYANEDGFLHIKTTGLYNETVNVIIRADGLEIRRAQIPLYHNKKSVVVNMREVIAQYCRIKKITDIPSVKKLSVEAVVTYEYRVFDKTISLQGNSLSLLVINKDTASPKLRSHTGSVYFNVNTGEAKDVEPTRYLDFQLGYMCHIEGVGKLANRYNNKKKDNPRFTVYPFHTYEIMLSDLVKCGLITENEAAYMTTVNHNMKNLIKKTDLNFNKSTWQLSANSNDLLINRFLDNSYRSERGEELRLANSEAIRKLLAQVQHKKDAFDGEDFANEVQYICRDAWQLYSSGVPLVRHGVSYTDPPGRYDYAMECPFGEYFLIYMSRKKYRLGVSRQPEEDCIALYDVNKIIGKPESPNRINRDGIRIHRGTAICSIGCLTHNVEYTGKNHTAFIAKIFPNNNNRLLNFICIDERNAIQLSPDQNNNREFYRYYDLIDPNQNQH